MILSEMESKNYTTKEMAIVCDISEREMAALKNREKADLKLSTLVKICENTSINFEEIFEFNDKKVFYEIIKKFYLTDGSDVIRFRV